MAGYSGTPLPKKLGIKEGHRVALLGAPKGFDRTLGALPADVVVERDLRGSAPIDVLVGFVTTQRDLRVKLPRWKKRIDWAGGLWVAWPKKSSNVPSDVTEDVVRALALSSGLVDNKVCAVDDTWSGLRLVYRVKDRPKAKAKPKKTKGKR